MRRASCQEHRRLNTDRIADGCQDEAQGGSDGLAEGYSDADDFGWSYVGELQRAWRRRDILKPLCGMQVAVASRLRDEAFCGYDRRGFVFVALDAYVLSGGVTLPVLYRYSAPSQEGRTCSHSG